MQEKNKEAMSTSPLKPVSVGIKMGTSSTVDSLMMSMGTQRGGASSGTRLQPQLASSSLGLTPVFDSVGDVRGMFFNVKTCL